MKPEPKLSAEGLSAFEALEKAYGSGSVRTHATASIDLGTIEVAVDLFRSEIDRAKAEFDSMDYVAAKEHFSAIAQKADKIPNRTDSVNEVRMRARTGCASSMLNMQDMPGALAVLREVDEQYLTDKQRASVSIMLAQLGDLSRAAAIADKVGDGSIDAVSARQIAAIMRGEDPPEELRAPLVYLKLSEQRLVRGDARGASEAALLGLGGDAKPELIENGLVCTLMHACCLSLTEQCGTDRTMSAAQLRDAIAVVDGYKPKAALPERLQAAYVDIAFEYARCGLDHRLLKHLREQFPTDFSRVEKASADLQSMELAKGGAVTDAIGLVGGDSAAWQIEARRLHLISLGGDTRTASQGLTELVAKYPGKFPIEALASELAIQESRFDDALKHAETAVSVFPSVGARLLVARSAIANKNGRRALEIAQGLDLSTDEVFLWVLGQAADATGDPRAVDYWHRYLALRPESTRGRISWALALNRGGEHERAAEETVGVIEQASGSMSIQELVACGQLQLAASPSPKRKDLVRRVADLILERFGTDPEAQLHRFMLLAGIVEQRKASVDFEKLETAGHVQSVTFDELLATFRSRADAADAALNLYRAGCLTVEAFVRVTNGRTATFVAEVLAGRAQLRTSMLIHDGAPRKGLKGKRVLVSLIELILLEHLGLFEHVEQLLGPSGRLVIFEDVWTQLLDDTVFLQQVAQTEEAARLGDIAARLATNSKYEIARTESTDSDVAQTRGVPFVSLSAEDRDLGWLAGVLVERAVAPIANVRAFANAHARPISQPSGEAIPKTVQLDQAVIEGLAIHGLLSAAEETFEQIIVGPSSMKMLESRRARLDSDLAAMRLMQAVKRSTGRARARGSLEVVPRPRVGVIDELPCDEDKWEWTRKAICEPVAYKQWLLDEPEGLRATAEFVGSLMPMHPDLWRQQAWPDARSAQSAWNSFRGTSDREWTLVELVRLLEDTPRRREALAKLGELGFQDALGVSELMRIVEEYGRLDVGKGAKLLDRIEALIDSPTDTWASLARMRLTMTYASLIWGYVRLDDGPRAVQFTRELVARATALGTRTNARAAEVLIGHLILHALEQPTLSMTDDTEQKVLTLRRSGAVVDVWKEIRRWSEGDDARMAACRRAVSYGWEKLHEIADEGPRNAMDWAPIALACDRLVPPPGNSVERIPSPDAVVAVFSALWTERPLRIRTATLSDKTPVDVEMLLERGVERMRERAVSAEDESTASYSVQGAGTSKVKVMVPIEALLLRSDSAMRTGLAEDIAKLVGPMDGRLYSALVRFAEGPDDRERQTELAVAATTAPFRLVSDDPAMIRYWGERSTVGQQGYPATFDDLCELLSEPTTFAARPDREIKSRVEDGSWRTRPDVGLLMLLAGRVPGPGVASIGTFVAQQSQPEMWDEIIETLSDTRTAPITRLAQAVALAALAPLHSETPVDQTALDDGLRAVFAHLASDGDTEFVQAEGRSIAMLERIIRRVAGARPVPQQQFIWLTFRLYEWWCRVSTPEERASVSRDEPGTAEWNEFRSSVVLNVLLDVCEMVAVGSRMRPENLRVLRDALVQRATTEAWKADKFGMVWGRPQGGGWLAANILLWISPSHFMELPPEVRLRVFENLPSETDSVGDQVLPHMSFVDGIVANIEKLSEEEKRAVNAWLSRLGDSDIARFWKVSIWSRLLTLGDDSVHDKLRALVDAAIGSDRYVGFVEQYVTAFAREDITSALLTDAATYLAASAQKGGLVADGFIAAWRREPQRLRELKQALTEMLLIHGDEDSQAQASRLRDEKEPEIEAPPPGT